MGAGQDGPKCAGATSDTLTGFQTESEKDQSILREFLEALAYPEQ